MDMINTTLLLNFLNVLVLGVCLFIIRDALKSIHETTEKGSVSAILYLNSKKFLHGLKIILLAVIVGALNSVLRFVKEYITLVEDAPSLPLEEYHRLLFEVLTLFTVLLLSYGLYVITVSFNPYKTKSAREFAKRKKEKTTENKE